MQPLFDDHERDIRLKFTFTEPADNHNREVSFTGCPDCIISVFPHQTDNAMNVGYGEAKRQCYTTIDFPDSCHTNASHNVHLFGFSISLYFIFHRLATICIKLHFLVTFPKIHC
ncbi:hypothetical protein EDC94DRAFT_590698 [Helicostylum pulchrum]|nr:hypothetical protein EDC94DRAFT_590698 [Helicostylum pulchrum]